MAGPIHHMGLTVGDLDRSVAFYTGYFGLKEIGRNEMRGRMISAQTDLPETVIDAAMLAGPNTMLELLCYRSPEGRPAALRACDPGAAHICMAVEDLDATYAAMLADGIAMHARPAALGSGTKMVYIRDPDGIMVEVIEPEEDLSLEAMLARAQADGPAAPLDFTRP